MYVSWEFYFDSKISDFSGPMDISLMFVFVSIEIFAVQGLLL